MASGEPPGAAAAGGNAGAGAGVPNGNASAGAGARRVRWKLPETESKEDFQEVPQPRTTPKLNFLPANDGTPRRPSSVNSAGPGFGLARVPAVPRRPMQELREGQSSRCPPSYPTFLCSNRQVENPVMSFLEPGANNSGLEDGESEVPFDCLSEQRSSSSADRHRKMSNRRMSNVRMLRKNHTQSSDELGKAKKEEGITQHRDIFFDVSAMKERVRKNLAKPEYNVANFYNEYGIWQAVAKHPTFEKITMALIALNAIWIAVDTDFNKKELLLESHPVFQLAENFFCSFFLFEWTCRLLAFKRKWDGLQDSWFIFDGLMVMMMVFETWCFTVIILAFSSNKGKLGVSNISVLRMARLLRLGRIFRMARILRMMPELVVLMKGLAAAFRSVFFTLLMLVALCFLFAIAFTQLTAKTSLGDIYFSSVLESMLFLLMHGTLLLSTDYKILEIRATENGFWLTFLFFAFILCTAILLMNMLIGVLCEMVSVVAATEKEEMLVSFVNMKLTKVMALIDADGGGTISKDEFVQILDNIEAMQALQDVGVDVVGLVDFADFIFDGDEENTEEVELTLAQFMDIVLSLRGSNNATVKDMVDLRKFHNSAEARMKSALTSIHSQVKFLGDAMQQHQALLASVASSVVGQRVARGDALVAESSNGESVLQNALPSPAGDVNEVLSSSLLPQKFTGFSKEDALVQASTQASSLQPARPRSRSFEGDIPVSTPEYGVVGEVALTLPASSQVFCQRGLHHGVLPPAQQAYGSTCEEAAAGFRGTWCAIEASEVQDIAHRLHRALSTRSAELDKTMDYAFSSCGPVRQHWRGQSEQPRPAASPRANGVRGPEGHYAEVSWDVGQVPGPFAEQLGGGKGYHAAAAATTATEAAANAGLARARI